MTRARAACLLALVVTAACGHREPPEAPRPTPTPPRVPSPAPPTRPPVRVPEAAPRPVAAPFAGGPEIRIGLLVDVPRVTLGGGSALVVRSSAGGPVIVPGGRSATITPSGALVAIDPGDRLRTLVAPVVVEPEDPSGFVRVDGKDYRGTVEIRRSPIGLVVIDRLSLETYLGGVVAPELGVTDPDAIEALKAQAVIARTYAVKQQGRYRRQGFDLLATVADQKYDGVRGETSAAWGALAETKGEVLTWNGAPIDAFFHSTCGGRTAAGAEVFANADRPYLRSVSDLDPSGQAWCRSSPRFSWTETWDAPELVGALRRGLGLTADEAASVRSIAAGRISGSGRVTQLRVRLRGRDVVIDGSNAVRRALPPAGLDLLRSAAFTLTTRGTGERIEQLTAEGRGSGHGVGLCQWGAVGRARAGARYGEILSAYYPGTRLDRRW